MPNPPISNWWPCCALTAATPPTSATPTMVRTRMARLLGRDYRGPCRGPPKTTENRGSGQKMRDPKGLERGELSHSALKLLEGHLALSLPNTEQMPNMAA